MTSFDNGLKQILYWKFIYLFFLTESKTRVIKGVFIWIRFILH